MLNYPISEKICTRLIMLVQLDSSEINSPHNNGILSRYTTVESNLTSVTCLCRSEYMIVSFSYTAVIKYRCMSELLNLAFIVRVWHILLI